jgi:hypothetical protein
MKKEAACAAHIHTVQGMKNGININKLGNVDSE